MPPKIVVRIIPSCSLVINGMPKTVSPEEIKLRALQVKKIIQIKK
jgi:hypothetical protein